MRFIVSITLLMSSLTAGPVALASASAAWSPPRLDYRALISSSSSSDGANDVVDNKNNDNNSVDEIITSSLLQANSSQGMLSLTHVFSSQEKKDMLDAMMKCYLKKDQEQQGQEDGSEDDGNDGKMMMKSILYPDGTKRSTWAGGVSQSRLSPLSSSSSSNVGDNGDSDDPCDVLEMKSNPIRNAVTLAMENLALRMEYLLSNGNNNDLDGDDDAAARSPISFATRSIHRPEDASENEEGNKNHQFYAFHELIKEGDHLDHLHVYDKSSSSSTKNDNVKTLEWHTDYGWALAFLPGQSVLVSSSTSTASITTDNDQYEYTPSRGFYIQLTDGSHQEVTFTIEDDLVILLGDGVAHINDALDNKSNDGKENNEDRKDQYRLRSVPHAFSMTENNVNNNNNNNNNSLRLWYGRMMLFPSNLLHSTLNQPFGVIHQAMNEDPSYYLQDTHNTRQYALGCSQPNQLTPRLLADTTIECDTSSQFFCWHACFNHTEDVSPTSCQERNLELACVDTTTLEASGEVIVWDGVTHNKIFEPGCVDGSLMVVQEVEEVKEGSVNHTMAGDGSTGGESEHGHMEVTGSTGSPTISPEMDSSLPETMKPTGSTSSVGKQGAVGLATVIVTVGLMIILA